MADLKAQLEAMRAQNQTQPVQQNKVDLKSQLQQLRKQPTPTASEQPEQPGFFKSIAQGLGKMVAEPAVAVKNLVQSAPTYAQAIAQGISGDMKGASKTGMQAEKMLGASANVPFLGEVKPAFAEKAIAGDDLGLAKEVLGRGAELGSFIPGGGAASTVVKGGIKGLAKSAVPAMIESGVSGSLGFGGQALKENKPFSEVATESAKGFGVGAAFGAVPVVAKGLTGLAGKTGKFAAAKATGLEGSTIETALKRGPELAEARKAGFTREGLADKVKSRVTSIKNDLSETGKQYNPIRELETNYVSIPQERNLFREAISKFGYDIDEQTGKLLRSAESKPLSNADISSLEDFYSQYGKDRVLSANGFLNTREKLGKMADYTSPTRGTLEKISEDIREKYNEFGRKQLPGLEDVDAEWAPLKKFMTEDVKAFTDKDGNVKLAKVMSALKNPNNADKLAKLEKVSPGITDDFQILAAIEDITAAGEKSKVGTYAQSLIFGGGIGLAGAGVVGGPIAALLGVIVSNPKVIIPIIETYSKLKTKALGKLGSLSKVEGVANSAIQKIKSGVKPNPAEEKLVSEAIKDAAVNQKAYGIVAGVQPEFDEEGNFTGANFDPKMAAMGVGLGVAAEKLSPKFAKSIATRVDSEDMMKMDEFITHTNGKFPENVQLEIEARRMAEAMGINPDQTNKELAKKFNTIVDTREKIDQSIKKAKPLKDSLKADPLIAEAKKYKSAEEFVKAQPKTVNVWRKSRFSDGGAYLDYPIIRREESITLFQGGDGGQHWTSDKKYAEQFGKVKEKTGSFYQIDNGNRMTNVYVEAPSKSQLTDIWNKANKSK